MQTHEILRKYFEKRRKTPRFSLRSLAQRLNISPAFLSRVLSGKKPIPYALLLKLGPVLDIEPEVFATLKEGHTRPSDAVTPRRGRVQVQTEFKDWDLANQRSVSILREWYYLPILEFTTLSNYDGQPESIARKLGLSVAVVELAIRELVRMDLLVERSGRLVKIKKKLRWGSAKSLPEVREFHRQMMNRAQLELRTGTSNENFERRLITGITLTASAEKIASAKKKLAECLHEIANDLISSPGSEVYHLAAQFFPLTRK
jgi:uncharacterized protein (TIGR02147 family)